MKPRRLDKVREAGGRGRRRPAAAGLHEGDSSPGRGSGGRVLEKGRRGRREESKQGEGKGKTTEKTAQIWKRLRREKWVRA